MPTSVRASEISYKVNFLPSSDTRYKARGGRCLCSLVLERCCENLAIKNVSIRLLSRPSNSSLSFIETYLLNTMNAKG